MKKQSVEKTERPRIEDPHYKLTRLLRRAGYDVPEVILAREGFLPKPLSVVGDRSMVEGDL